MLYIYYEEKALLCNYDDFTHQIKMLGLIKHSGMTPADNLSS